MRRMPTATSEGKSHYYEVSRIYSTKSGVLSVRFDNNGAAGAHAAVLRSIYPLPA